MPPKAQYNTILHEVGHAIGIGHSDVHNVVMSGLPNSPYWNPGGVEYLQPDDIAAAQAIWGASDRPHPGELPSGLSDQARLIGGDDTITGTAHHERLLGGFGNDSIVGGAGNDTLMGNGTYWTHWNNPVDDYWSRTWRGLNDSDTIEGGPGDDWINGNAGADLLYGGPGNDTIYGGQNEGLWAAGHTRTDGIFLRGETDTLYGGPGDDVMNGNMGDDDLFGEEGNDLLRGGQDSDYLHGGLATTRCSAIWRVTDCSETAVTTAWCWETTTRPATGRRTRSTSCPGTTSADTRTIARITTASTATNRTMFSGSASITTTAHGALDGSLQEYMERWGVFCTAGHCVRHPERVHDLKPASLQARSRLLGPYRTTS